MTPRRRRYLATLLVFLTLTIVLVFLPRTAPQVQDLWAVIDSALDDAIARYLSQTPSDPRSSRTRQIQAVLRCLTEGEWVVQGPGSFQQTTRRFVPRCNGQFNKTDVTAQLCGLFSSKNALFVGPETTYYLHSLLLQAFQEISDRPIHCAGPSFCTSHNICQPGGKRNYTMNTPSLLRYTYSTTLYASDDARDPEYMTPMVDVQTGVRVRNSFWRDKARAADFLFLNRGPRPASAWSYPTKRSGGNWTFSGHQSNDILLPDGSISTNIMNAAVNAVLLSFLPDTQRLFLMIKQDRKLQDKIVIWLGDWYIQPQCSKETFRLAMTGHIFADSLLSGSTDAWRFYYNIQVHMQNKIMYELSPHHGVIFLPLALPIAPRDLAIHIKSKTSGHNARRFDCLRYPTTTPGGQAMQGVVMQGLVKLLTEILA